MTEPPLPPPPSGSPSPSPSADLEADPGDETAPIRRRGVLPVVLVAVVVVVVLLSGAAIAAVTLLGGGDGSHALTGTVAVGDLDVVDKLGGNCSGTGGYNDLGKGTNVVVTDGDGSVIATGKLGQGTWQSPIADQKPDRYGYLAVCEMPLELSSKLPKRDFYEIQVSHRGAPSYSYDELEASGWHLELAIGDGL